MADFSFIYAIDGIKDRDIVVYRYLDDRANRDGICWPGINTIARDLHRSRSTVKRAINELKGFGLITTKQRYRPNGGKSSLEYHLPRHNKSFYGGKVYDLRRIQESSNEQYEGLSL